MNVRVLAFVSAWAIAASTAFAQEAPAPAASPVESAATAAAAPAPVPAAAVPAVPAVVGDFKIGTEDVLDIQVWKNPDLSRVVPVRPDGFISLPLVNDIKAAGRTPTELRAEITERLAAFVPAAEVSVIVREVNSFRVSILGAVRMAGSYEVPSNATVFDAIARAQGLGDFAKRDKIIVHRRDGAQTKQLPFNYDRAAEGRDPNFTLQNGDIIVVP